MSVLPLQAESSSQEAKLADALAQLQLEDPSLVVEEDEDSGQTMMRGMGELHLDVAKARTSVVLDTTCNAKHNPTMICTPRCSVLFAESWLQKDGCSAREHQTCRSCNTNYRGASENFMTHKSTLLMVGITVFF